MGGETQPFQRLAAGPVDEFGVLHFGLVMLTGNDPFGQIIDLLEVHTAGNCKLAGVPEIFECGLGGMPVPPATGLVSLLFKLPRQHRPGCGDALQRFAERGIETLTVPFAPAFLNDRLAAAEAVFPIGIKFRRQDGGIMRPVLEKRAILFQQRGQMVAPVGLVAGENNLVMGARHRADAVHLHEAEIGDELQQPILGKRLAGRGGKALPRQKNSPCCFVRNLDCHGPEGMTAFSRMQCSLFLVSLLLMTGYRTGNEREDVSLEIRFDAAGVVFEGRQVLQPLSLTLTERRIGVIGLNGSGKTTFARLINGLNKPSEGKVSVNGLDTVSDARAILQMVGFIFQNPQNQIILPIVRDDVAFGLKRLGLGKAETENRVKVVLAGLGIAQLEDRRAHELSGGELQLAALAALLVTEPQILILDEPTNQLDLKNRAVVEITMAALSQALIVITHDLPLLRGFDRVLVFHEGALIADAAPEEAVARYLEVASR